MKDLTCAVFAGLDRPTLKTYHNDVLPIDIEVNTKESSDFVFWLLPPETLLRVIDTVGPVLQRIGEYLLIYLLQVLYLGLLIDVMNEFLALEHADGEVIWAYNQLLMPVVIPIHKLQGIRVVSCHCPEPFITLEIEAGDGAVATSYDQGLTPDLLYFSKGETAHTVRHLLVKHVLVVLNIYNHLLFQGTLGYHRRGG